MTAELRTKLQIKDGMAGKVINQPKGLDVAAAIGAGKGRSNLDYILVFAGCSVDVDRYSQAAVKALREDGLLWFAFPKKSAGLETDISRDSGWEPLSRAGYRPVRSIAIDDTWSALRFRERERVGTK